MPSPPPDRASRRRRCGGASRRRASRSRSRRAPADRLDSARRHGDSAANAHPGSSVRGSGGRPGMVASGRWRSMLRSGTAASKRAGVGMDGATVARTRSTRSPRRCGPPYITTMRPHSSATAETSWVMNTTAAPSFAVHLRSRSRTWRWTVTSRAWSVRRRRTSLGGPSAPWRSWRAAACRRRARGGRSAAAARGSAMATAPSLSARSSRRLGAAHAVVNLGHLSQLTADANGRVECRAGVLEHHRQRRPEQPPALARAQVGEVAAVEAQPGDGHLAGVLHELGDREGGDRLARARLADDPDDLAAPNRERHVAHREHVSVGVGNVTDRPLTASTVS